MGNINRRLEKLEVAAGATGEQVRILFEKDLVDGQAPEQVPGEKLIVVRFVSALAASQNNFRASLS